MAIGQRWKVTGIGLAQLDGERQLNYLLTSLCVDGGYQWSEETGGQFRFHPNISALDSQGKVGSLIRTLSDNGTCEGPSEQTIFSMGTHLSSIQLCPRVDRLDNISLCG